MQELDFLILLISNILLIILIVGFFLFILSRRKTSGEQPTRVSHKDPTHDSESDEFDSEETDEANRIVRWIRKEQEKAQDSIDHGEFRKASEQLSTLLEGIYHDMAKLAPLGPKNYSQIKEEIEYTLGDTKARALLEDLKVAVESVDDLPRGEINVWDAAKARTQLDVLSEEGNTLADEAEDLAEKTSSELIIEEARLLRKELRMKIHQARDSIKKRLSDHD